MSSHAQPAATPSRIAPSTPQHQTPGAQPGQAQVLLLLAGMALLWTLACALSHSAPDLDGMEELVWATSFEWGYAKHPPLPSWLLYAITHLTGRPIWLTFLAGQLTATLALWIIWRMGCEFTSPARALMATAILSVSAYFSIRGTIYNHNTVQLWSIAACTWLFYRALRHQRALDWIGAGIVGALAFMTKYSAMIQFAAFFVFMLWQGSLRDLRTWKGIALALAAFLATIAPHLAWLAASDFAPMRYADRALDDLTHLQALGNLADFLLDQAGRLSPMLVVLLALAWWNRRHPINAATSTGANTASANTANGPQAISAPRYADDLSAWDKSFLLWVGLFPLLSTVVLSAILATHVQASWATTFFILFGFYALWRLSGDERILLRRTLTLVIIVHLLMALGYAIGRGPLAHYSGKPSRSTYPGQEVSDIMQQVWHRHVPGQPLRVVASDTWLGGNIAMHAAGDVQVFIDADYTQSPWLDEGTALDCGALVVYSTEPRGALQPSLEVLYDTTLLRGESRVRWSSERSPMIVLHWGIIPPDDACRARR